tara:strand:+ start:918 stop:1454 length:537 start_codon:yes stop_codon:yes gene_type:complete
MNKFIGQSKSSKYNLLSRFFHWISALGLLIQVPLGFYLVGLDFSELRITIEDWHVFIGICILYITIFRLLVKFFSKTPAQQMYGFPGQKLIAKTNHFLLYMSVFIITISGILKKLFNGEELNMFMFDVKLKSDFDKADFFYDIHVYSNYLLISLVTLHILAVIFHKLVLKENILKRIL